MPEWSNVLYFKNDLTSDLTNVRFWKRQNIKMHRQVTGCLCLKMVEVKIPPHTIRTHPVTLECNYDLQGEALYSVKWYKDGREFYRYVPGDLPNAQVFDLAGVYVDLRAP
ncbi:hypothetical protein FOCC_FOCC013515 [Frankliniella occidentalis]|nr:hypothetical protein FOCC_FOCC013515 [Frankliniella occidentalis]